jgi:pimeloyl-ACP methyl ester carboxylesterase
MEIREEIAGTVVNFNVSGRNSPTLIFVHGLSCTGHDWDEQVALLSDDYRTVSVDLPGHGESDLPKDATLAHLSEVVATLARRYGESGAVLIGHSTGCRVVARAYMLCAEQAHGLVFVDGSVLGNVDNELVVKAFSSRISTLGMGGYVERAIHGMFTEKSNPALRRRALDQAKGMDDAFGRAIWIDTLKWEGRELAQTIAGIKVPVLVLQSTAFTEVEFGRRSLEPGMTTPWMEYVAERVPDTHLRVIPGVGHFPHFEAPEAVAQALRDFLVNLP